MKKLLSLLLVIYLLVPAAHSQEKNVRPAALGVSFFLNDFTTADRIRTSSLSSVLSNKQWSKISDMNPGLAITYFKGLRPHIDVAASLGGSFVNYPMPGKSFSDNGFLLEGNASLNFKMTTEDYFMQPYISVGLGAHQYRGYYGAFIPVGLGMKFNLFDESHVFITSTYRLPVTTGTANYHFQHGIGIAGRIGKPKEVKLIEPPKPPSDRDGDGIFDAADKCPDVKGIEKYEGCPIPDTDKDGINDEEDKCPTEPGVARYQGCPVPDSDKDGITDEEDKCPQVAGLARYNGCPIPDRDNDGVNDEEDKCPELAGTVANFGCPEITEEIKKKVEVAAKNILFVTGSAKLRTESNKKLNDVITIMNENPDMLLSIDGHTDDVGDEAKNQALSENRANAVKAYLVGKGIAEGRITATGYGESKPIADNKTATGRQANRRSELTLSYFK